MKVTIGAHNLHDEAGTPTFPASIMFFTEAVPEKIHALLPDGWKMAVCPEQHDLVIAWDANVFTPRTLMARSYRRLVRGRAKVTPNRGTYVIKGEFANGRKAALVVSHRINAAFPPYTRGEGAFRHKEWEKHTAYDIRRVKRLKRNRVVLAGGDLNTPTYITGWRGAINEISTSLDRLGSSEPLRGLVRGPFNGSDHRLITATTLI